MLPIRSLTSLAVALPRPRLALDDIVPQLDRVRPARILLTGADPCAGEDGVQAARVLAAHGIRCIVSPQLGEPFATYCVARGILPVVLAETALRPLWTDAASPQTALLTIDLQRSEIVRAGGAAVPLRIDPLVRRRFLAIAPGSITNPSAMGRVLE